MKGKGFWVLRGLKFVVLGAAFVVAAGFAVMLLWNWLMPAIFGWSTITWVQALGLFALSKILFGGRGHGGWGGRGCGGGRHHMGRHGHWRKRWEEKWSSMSEEERAKVRAHWGNRCGGKFPMDEPESNPAESDKAAS